MSPVFRHGGLRLYLLKLLDEAPRHGYDVIRLLQDKFLGVYSPSPGTIYPRLARLEAEGLVTHETVDGKKVYKITDAGRAELSRRLDDLADLEDELAASVRDIATEISRDVRETVRNLRDELTWAVREAGRSGRGTGAATDADAGVADAAGSRTDGADGGAAGETAGGARTGRDGDEQAGQRQGRRGRGDWGDWAERRDWNEWVDWASKQDWKDWAKASGSRDRREPRPDLISDLEHLAAAFAREIRGVARRAENLSDDTVGNLGRVLFDTLNKIRTEVFRAPEPGQAPGSEQADAQKDRSGSDAPPG